MNLNNDLVPLDLEPINNDLVPISPPDDLEPIEPTILDRMFMPITKQIFGKSIGDVLGTTGGLERKSKELVNQSDLDVQQDLKGQAGKTIKVPKTPSTTDFFMKQLGSATAETLVNTIDPTPTDAILMLATAGIAKVPVKGVTIGQIATRTNVTGGVKAFKDSFNELKGLNDALNPLKHVDDVYKNLQLSTTSKEFLKNKDTKNVLRGIADTALNIMRDPDGVDKAPSLANSYTKENGAMRSLVEGLLKGEIPAEDLPDVLQSMGKTHVQWAKFLKQNVSEAGKVLNIMSQYSRGILQGLDKEAMDIISPNRVVEPHSFFSHFSEGFKGFVNTWRALLVTQLATSVRNVVTQSAMLGTNIFTQGVAGVLEKTMGGVSARKAFAPLNESVLALFRPAPLNSKTMGKISSILADFPIQEYRLFSRPMSDLVFGGKGVFGGKMSEMAKKLNIINTAQEYYFRRIAFDSKIESLMTRNGLTGYNQLTEQHVSEAVEHALKMTFANLPKHGTIEHNLLGILNNPYMTFSISAFPRFYINSMNFLWEHNPTGILPLLGDTARKVLTGQAVGALDRIGYETIGKAVVGSSLLAAAIALRSNPELAGEKWDQVKTGRTVNGKEEQASAKAYAPFSTYLYIADVLVNPDKKGNLEQGFQVATGISRISDTGLGIVDIVRSTNEDGIRDSIATFWGKRLAGFTTPLKTIRDFMAQVDPEERIVRSTRENPLFGPTIANVPILEKTLPAAPDPLEGGPLRSETSMAGIQAQPLRQLSGLTLILKTSLEKEVDRLGIKELYPKSGDKTLDRLISEHSGRWALMMGTAMVESPGWNNLDDYEKDRVLRNMLSLSRTSGKAEVFFPSWFFNAYSKIPKSSTPGQHTVEQVEFLNQFLNTHVSPKKYGVSADDLEPVNDLEPVDDLVPVN